MAMSLGLLLCPFGPRQETSWFQAKADRLDPWLHSYRFASWSWTLEQSPPESGSPRTTSDPSARMAAKAKDVAQICWWTFWAELVLDCRRGHHHSLDCLLPLLSHLTALQQMHHKWLWHSLDCGAGGTNDLEYDSPQPTTDPSARKAANETMPLSRSSTEALLPPKDGSPHVTTDPSARIAANAPRVAWTCCTRTSWSLNFCHHKMDGSMLSHLPGVQRLLHRLLGSSEYSWAGLWLLRCRHQNLDCTTQQRHLLGLQQTQIVWREPAERSWADLGLKSCHHRILGDPTSQLIYLPGSQQMHQASFEFAAQCWADFGLGSCHHLFLDHPTSQPIHLPGLQRMRHTSLQFPQRSWADLGLKSCHHQIWITTCSYWIIWQDWSASSDCQLHEQISPYNRRAIV